jgi:hypothetical protein
VLSVGGAPTTSTSVLLERVMDAGEHAALSHTSALAHWGVRGFVADPVHITRRRDLIDHPVPGAVIHEVRFLPADQVRVLEAVPVVSPALALLQLAGMRCSDLKLGLAIDAAWSDRLVSYSTLRAIDQLMSRQGRRGLRRFRQMVEERGSQHVPPASNLEGRFAQLLIDVGRPPMLRQVDVADDSGWIGRVDFRDAELPVIAEVQSERFHSGLVPRAQDRQRIARLQDAGFEVIEVTDTDLFMRPRAVLAAVDAARRRARTR